MAYYISSNVNKRLRSFKTEPQISLLPRTPKCPSSYFTCFRKWLSYSYSYGSYRLENHHCHPIHFQLTHPVYPKVLMILLFIISPIFISLYFHPYNYPRHHFRNSSTFTKIPLCSSSNTSPHSSQSNIHKDRSKNTTLLP